MFSSKYYDNPFADDDNGLCYSEILSDQGEQPANHDNSNSNNHINSNAGHSSPDSREKRPNAASAGSPAALSRRNGAEAPNTEIALSAVRSGDEWGPAGQRGGADANDYEDYIAELRAELEGANAENNRLTAAQTKAEARARGLLFDKENAEWQLQQEKERSRALAEKVAALEEELEQMASRTGDFSSAARPLTQAIPPPQHRHVDPHDASLRAAPPASHAYQHGGVNSNDDGDGGAQDLVSTPLPERQRSMRARAQFQQRQAAYLESRGASFERDTAEAATPASSTADVARSAEPQAESLNSGLTCSVRGQRRAEAVQEKLLQQQKLASEQAAEVRELEELLQTHCQKRDELATQLQRLESMRLRTVAEKRRKAAVEMSLEEEEKTIGHIRLELRSHSALVR